MTPADYRASKARGCEVHGSDRDALTIDVLVDPTVAVPGMRDAWDDGVILTFQVEYLQPWPQEYTVERDPIAACGVCAHTGETYALDVPPEMVRELARLAVGECDRVIAQWEREDDEAFAEAGQ